MFDRLFAVSRGHGKPPQVNQCPGLHLRLGLRFQGLLEQLFRGFGVLLKHRDPRETIVYRRVHGRAVRLLQNLEV